MGYRPTRGASAAPHHRSGSSSRHDSTNNRTDLGLRSGVGLHAHVGLLLDKLVAIIRSLGLWDAPGVDDLDASVTKISDIACH
jgi:hypothetical protein